MLHSWVKCDFFLLLCSYFYLLSDSGSHIVRTTTAEWQLSHKIAVDRKISLRVAHDYYDGAGV